VKKGAEGRRKGFKLIRQVLSGKLKKPTGVKGKLRSERIPKMKFRDADQAEYRKKRTTEGRGRERNQKSASRSIKRVLNLRRKEQFPNKSGQLKVQVHQKIPGPKKKGGKDRCSRKKREGIRQKANLKKQPKSAKTSPESSKIPFK